MKDIFDTLLTDYTKDELAEKYNAKMIRIQIYKNEKEYVIEQLNNSIKKWRF